MKPISTLLAVVAISTFAISPALADCPTAAGSAQNDTQKGISKDGTHAPLEDSSNTQNSTTGTTTSSSAKAPQKSGDAVPMQADKNLATSQQDVEAQQKGDKTAAAKADDKDCKS